MAKRSNVPNSVTLAQHYGADAAQGSSNTASEGKEYRSQRRKIIAQGGTPETQDHHKREITIDGTSYAPDEVEEYRLRRGIRVVGWDDVPDPIMTFDNTRFPEHVIQEFSKAGFVRPTPIQAQVWPMDLEDRDLIGIAQPGSGKMLGYLIPAILHVNSQPKRSRGGDGPIVLILAPTTQRAEQIQQEGAKFGAAYNIKVLSGLYLLKHENSGQTCGGGILIDTLSSLLVLLKSKSTNLKSVTYLVLDGADWMLSDTHEPQIRNILSQIRLDCQKSFWGASWPEEVDKRAKLFLHNACKVQIVSPILKVTPPVNQIVYVLTEDQKYNKLVELLGGILDGSRIVIFMDTKKGCESRDQIALQLCTDGQHAVLVHGNKSQAEGVRIVSEFQAGKIPIMIATDVAARDLDLKDVKYVINYDFPGSLDDYVYHIDCFGSAAAKGTAYTFFTTANAGCAKGLTILLKKAGQNVSSELEQLGRDVTYPGTYIPRTWRWEANNKMGLQAHFVRVVEAYEFSTLCFFVSMTYLTFEAADPATYEKKLYRAIVVKASGKKDLMLFGMVNSDGRLSKMHDIREGVEYPIYSIWREDDEDDEDNEDDNEDEDEDDNEDDDEDGSE
ncbi:DEAD-box ATP-dependent RNA helicase 20-like isoform X2 [Malus sylvestris]|uniref:DEAD-box ATP-dependent RNA helicase 20-like isoform X2 n=1 Tax=Malus sylvestris TaxID=3752 RepID=UPI0021AC2EB1|nr:DEAD-box ATP-dependent RNA helicase 20-like isoform X2 [Malus sylvestris]